MYSKNRHSGTTNSLANNKNQGKTIDFSKIDQSKLGEYM